MFELRRQCCCFSYFDDLDEDILVEIICRLPVKCMVRSMCVCKQWHELISAICIPRIKSSLPHALLLRLCTRFPTPVTGPFTLAWINSPPNRNHLTSLTDFCHNLLPFSPSPEEFLDCCNGIFLFFCQSTREFFVCNPTTEQRFSIPNSPQNDTPDSAALFFDPNCKICYISKIFPFTVNIYSIQTRLWSVHKFLAQPPSAANGLIRRHVFVNGLVYRLSFNGYLLGINIKQMRVYILKLPEVVTAKEHPIGCIGVSQDRLHYAWEVRESQIMVWQLGEGGIADGWVLKYTISHQCFVEHPLCRNLPLCSVLAIDPTSNVFFIGTAMIVFQYDPCNKVLETVCRFKKGTYLSAGQYFVFPFSPSLTILDAPSQSINN